MKKKYSTNRALDEANEKLEIEKKNEERLTAEIAYSEAVIEAIKSSDDSSEKSEDIRIVRETRLIALNRELLLVRRKIKELDEDIFFLAKLKTQNQPPLEKNEQEEKPWFANIKSTLEQEKHVMTVGQLLEKIKPNILKDKTEYRELLSTLASILRTYESRGKLIRTDKVIQGKWAYGLPAWWENKDELNDNYLP